MSNAITVSDTDGFEVLCASPRGIRHDDRGPAVTIYPTGMLRFNATALAAFGHSERVLVWVNRHTRTIAVTPADAADTRSFHLGINKRKNQGMIGCKALSKVLGLSLDKSVKFKAKVTYGRLQVTVP